MVLLVQGLHSPFHTSITLFSKTRLFPRGLFHPVKDQIHFRLGQGPPQTELKEQFCQWMKYRRLFLICSSKNFMWTWWWGRHYYLSLERNLTVIPELEVMYVQVGGSRVAVELTMYGCCSTSPTHCDHRRLWLCDSMYTHTHTHAQVCVTIQGFL